MTRLFLLLFFQFICPVPALAVTYCAIPVEYSSQGYHGEIAADGCTCQAKGENYVNDVCNVCAGTCGADSGGSGSGSGSNSTCSKGAAPPSPYATTSSFDPVNFPSNVCVGGCTYPVTGAATSPKPYDKWNIPIGTGTGASCTGTASGGASGTSSDGTITADPGKDSNPCVQKGQCGGTVNGVEACHVCPPDVKTATKSPVSSEKKTSNSDTGGSTSTKNEAVKTTVCENGACTTVITNNYNTTNQGGGSGGSASGSGSGNQINPNAPANGSQTETKTESQASFCKENPDSAVCKGFNDECKDNPNRVGCANLGTPSDSDGGPLSTKSIGLSSIAVVPLASNASCPAPIPLPRGLSFDFGMMCNFATGIRPIVLVIAWLAAGMIVFGFKSES